MFNRFLFTTLSLLVATLLFSQDTLVIKGNLSGGNIWQSSKVYVLDGEVTLVSGNLLIQRGTRIIARANPSDPETSLSGLTITPNARVVAQGTESQPIVFTAENESLFERGSWRGISIYGKPEETSLYSALSHVSIRYAGGSEDGISGAALFLQDLDDFPKFEFIEVYYSGGDGVRIHGGEAELNNISVNYARDDAFDWDFGWTGSGLYWFAYHVGRFGYEASYTEKSYAIEGKGNPDVNGIVSQPKIFNATLIGTTCTYFQPENDNLGNDAAVCFKDNSGGILANSLILDFPEGGIWVEDLLGEADSRYQMETGNLIVANNIWRRFYTRPGFSAASLENTLDAMQNGIIVVDASAEDPDADFLVQHLVDQGNVIGEKGIRANRNGNCLALDPRPHLQSGFDTLPAFPYPNDFFFLTNVDDESLKGAFPSNGLWLYSWTALSQSSAIGDVTVPYFYLPNGRRIVQNDTLSVDCEEMVDFHSQIESEFPCQPEPDLIASASRRGNKRRPARRKSGNDELPAYIEEWWYEATYLGCDDPLRISFTILVFDTIPPVIHPIPDGEGGLTAIVEDCDEAWLTGTIVDTVNTENGGLAVQYRFSAEDYSGNTAELTILKPLSGTPVTLYADLDGDGYGRPELSITCYGPLPGFVDNNDDCNDNDPEVNVFDPFNFKECHTDFCENAPLLTVGTECDDYMPISLVDASRSVYPVPAEDCGVNNFYRDSWFRFQSPAGGSVWMDFVNYSFESAASGFVLELYAGDCNSLELVDCFSGLTALSTLIQNLNPDEIYYVRVLEPANISFAKFQVCLVDAANVVTNFNCGFAEPIPPSGEDCSYLTFDMTGAGRPDSLPASCAQLSFGSDVWFSYMPQGNDSIQIEVFNYDGPLPYYSSIHVFDGECAELVELACYQVLNTDPARFAVHDFSPDAPLLIQFLTNEPNLTYEIDVCQTPSTTTPVVNRELATPDIHLYPNPTEIAGELTISVLQPGSASGTSLRCSLLDSQGRLLQVVFDQDLPAGTHSFLLRKPDLPAGLYWLYFQGPAYTSVKKWVVIK